MTHEKSSIENLIDLGKLDASIGLTLAEKNRLNDALKEKAVAYEEASLNFKKHQLNTAQLKDKYRKDENSIKHEQDKLVDRRKALRSLTNYKLAQSAEKEVEHSSKLLNAQEEVMLKLLEQIEKAESELGKAIEVYEKAKEELEALQADSGEAIKNLDERLSEKQAERSEIIKDVPADQITFYQRVQNRYPSNPIVSLKNGKCSGCYMQVGPQIVVEVYRGNSVVRCRGCGRILYIEHSKEE